MRTFESLKIEHWEGTDYVITGLHEHSGVYSKRDASVILAFLKDAIPFIQADAIASAKEELLSLSNDRDNLHAMYEAQKKEKEHLAVLLVSTKEEHIKEGMTIAAKECEIKYLAFEAGRRGASESEGGKSARLCKEAICHARDERRGV